MPVRNFPWEKGKMGEEEGGKSRKGDPLNNALYLSEQEPSSVDGFCCPPAGDNITGQREPQRRTALRTLPFHCSVGAKPTQRAAVSECMV